MSSTEDDGSLPALCLRSVTPRTAAWFWGAMLSGRTIGEELKTASPVTLTPLAVILALLIAFVVLGSSEDRSTMKSIRQALRISCWPGNEKLIPQSVS
jgi:hypothetical protein